MMKVKTWDDCSLDEQIERMEQMLRVLGGLNKHERRKHFNMGTWGEKTPCGTVACAAGHAGLDPWFRRRGFRLDFKRHRKRRDEWGELREAYWSYDFPNAGPNAFFGTEVFEGIFVNNEEVRGIRQAERAIRDYIGQLKDAREARESTPALP